MPINVKGQTNIISKKEMSKVSKEITAKQDAARELKNKKNAQKRGK
jgi:hypothetical protein